MATNNANNNNRHYGSASAYAMSLPELVINVVRYLPSSSLRGCSQVSRVWYTSTYSRRLSYGEFATATRELFESSPKKIYVLSTFVLQYSPSINLHHTPPGPYQFVFSCQTRGGSMDSYASTNSEEKSGSSGSGGSSGDNGAHFHRHHNHQPGHSSVSPHSFHTFQSSAIIPNVFFRSAIDFPSYLPTTPPAPPVIVPSIPLQPQQQQQQQPHQPHHPQQQPHQPQQLQQTELYPQTLVLPPPMTLSIGQQLDALASTQPHISLLPSNSTHPLQHATTIPGSSSVPALLGEIAELTLLPHQMQNLARFQSESAQSSSASSQQQSRQPSQSQEHHRSSIHIVPCPFEYASDGSMSFDEGSSTQLAHHPSREGRHNSGSDNSQRSRSDSSSDSMGTGEIMFGSISTSAPHESSTTMQSHMEALQVHHLRKGKGRASEYSRSPHVTDSSEHSQGEILLSESDPLEMLDRRGSTTGTTSSSSFGQPPDLSRSRGRGGDVCTGESSSLSSGAAKGKGKAGSRRTNSNKASSGPQLPNWSMALGTYYYYMMAKNAMVVACREHMESEQGQGAHIVEMTETTRIVWNETTSQEHIWTITPTLMDRTNPGDRVEKDYDPHAEMEERSSSTGTMRGWMSPRLMATVAERREHGRRVEDEEELDEEDTYEEDEEDNGDDDGDADMI
ncbi:hypothetical protein BGZ52_006426 [Haplosporangium bisporale]|nr:hypothetical protein BGZ52_006426 [Haplosporangium bisporale]